MQMPQQCCDHMYSCACVAASLRASTSLKQQLVVFFLYHCMELHLCTGTVEQPLRLLNLLKLDGNVAVDIGLKQGEIGSLALSKVAKYTNWLL